ncbi:hypothetical protein ACH5RR_034708 [Cinchona calisaya]|uniref:Uncharacterized protein n=1 Tax=Cinchona calisaya TaxID=153742 RepID=A0ABD2YBQ2_9GENT
MLKRNNLSNATNFQGSKQVKIKAKRLSSNGSNEKNFKRTRRYKGLSPESSPETEYTTPFTNLIDQTAGPSVVNEPASKVLSPVPINPQFFQAIVKLMTSSDLSELLKSREAVYKHLMRLNGVVLDGDAGRIAVDWFVERVQQTVNLAKKISSHEEFVKDVDRVGVEILSRKLSDHLKTLQDLNS